jgi:8-oxo-dGTP pyrophosphatase MutT (NUDIX family)
MIISCGFLIESDNKVLLCHATNGFNKPSVKGFRYGIPKGQIDGSEYFLETAIRELKEETDLDLLDLSKSIKVSSNYASVRYKSGKKTLKVFKVLDAHGELLKFPFKCNTYFEHRGQSLPEVDSFIWMDYKTAAEICIKGQRELFTSDYDWSFSESSSA